MTLGGTSIVYAGDVHPKTNSPLNGQPHRWIVGQSCKLTVQEAVIRLGLIYIPRCGCVNKYVDQIDVGSRGENEQLLCALVLIGFEP